MGRSTDITLPMEFQAAAAEDVPVILAEAIELVDQYEDRSLIDYDKVISWMRRKIENNISKYTCVRIDGCKVAYYSLTSRDGSFELDDFYVLPNFRGHGIGSAILKKCLTEITGQVRLFVFKGNIGAVSLYERHGFTVEQQVSSSRMIMSRWT